MGITDCCASAAARLLSSSLYFVAALQVYLTLVSLLASAAEPPLDWKYLVADSFPPTFINRSCSHCHSASNTQTISMHPYPLVHPGGGGLHTVEIRGTDKGDMNPQVSMVGRTVQTQVNSQRNRRPRRILGATIETDLPSDCQYVLVQTGGLPCVLQEGQVRALFAGLVLSFSKIF